MGEALEGLRLRVGVLDRADEGERIERADHQRALAVEEPDRALGVDPAQDRAALGEVAPVAHFVPAPRIGATSVRAISRIASSSESGRALCGISRKLKPSRTRI